MRHSQIVEGDCNLDVILPIVPHLDVDGAFENVLGLLVVLEFQEDYAQDC